MQTKTFLDLKINDVIYRLKSEKSDPEPMYITKLEFYAHSVLQIGFSKKKSIRPEYTVNLTPPQQKQSSYIVSNDFENILISVDKKEITDYIKKRYKTKVENLKKEIAEKTKKLNNMLSKAQSMNIPID